jgi:hypothetical protein
MTLYMIRGDTVTAYASPPARGRPIAGQFGAGRGPLPPGRPPGTTNGHFMGIGSSSVAPRQGS